ncbi:MarR family EPS-associated transcriptional regulator [uncultured Propionivibrio sp.]|uniref:MarR family EPS-associated transcriptional regulator n=1 Tax=uncultured Propionivibrio sp. TaxID=426737 RepID=UPI0029C0F4C8|nr:MarR family EPS-associated transcriptional regulator [uncultured Propionivibrio sp.]
MSIVSPLQKLAGFQNEIQFEILLRLHQTSEAIQREQTKVLAMSIGAINFCFQALVEKSLVKIQSLSLSLSKNKLRYTYSLTPTGVAEKSRLTAKFLRQKAAEYGTFQAEIEKLIADLLSDERKAEGWRSR